jgi:hypothetical protein
MTVSGPSGRQRVQRQFFAQRRDRRAVRDVLQGLGHVRVEGDQRDGHVGVLGPGLLVRAGTCVSSSFFLVGLVYLLARSLTDFVCYSSCVVCAGNGEMDVDGDGVGGVQPVVLPRPP